jgi:hypothetical protein
LNSSRASRCADEQRELLGRRQQDVRRALDLAGALVGGVSPVRVSMRIGSPISRAGISRLRATSTASAFKGEM